MQPTESNTPRCSSSTAITRGSTGNPPTSLLQATLAPSRARSRGREKRLPGSSRATGERGSGPEIALSIRATSPTVRAIGPSTENGNQAASLGHVGTLPWEGRNPTTLQKPRPPAAPPLLPPHVLVVS